MTLSELPMISDVDKLWIKACEICELKFFCLNTNVYMVDIMTDTLGLNLPLVYEVVKSGELWEDVFILTLSGF